MQVHLYPPKKKKESFEQLHLVEGGSGIPPLPARGPTVPLTKGRFLPLVPHEVNHQQGVGEDPPHLGIGVGRSFSYLSCGPHFQHYTSTRVCCWGWEGLLGLLWGDGRYSSVGWPAFKAKVSEPKNVKPRDIGV